MDNVSNKKYAAQQENIMVSQKQLLIRRIGGKIEFLEKIKVVGVSKVDRVVTFLAILDFLEQFGFNLIFSH